MVIGKLDRREAAGAAICAALLIAGLLLTYQRIVFGDRTTLLGRYDVYRYFGPMVHYMDASIHDGTWPLWNPLTFCGTPFAANPQAMLWYPPNMVRSLLTLRPTPMATQIGIVIMMGFHLLFAGVGVRQLARAHGLSPAAALASALTFVFSALMVRRVCEYHFLMTLAWLPWLLLAVKRALDAPDSRSCVRSVLLGGLAAGMALLGGSFQIMNYMGVAALAYACLYRVLYRRFFPGNGDGARKNRSLWQRLFYDTLTLAAVFGLGALLASVLLLPALELAGRGARQDGSVALYANLLGQSPVSLIQRLIVYPGMRYEAETIRGAGVAALLLAMASLLSSRRRETWVFLGVLLVLADCCFGPPFPIATLVTVFTPFTISAHVRACDVAMLPFAMLAGFGVDAITGAVPSARGKLYRSLFVLATGTAVMAGLVRWAGQGPFVPASAWAILLPGAAMLLMAAGGWVPWKNAVRWMLPALLFVETLAWNVRYVPALVDAPPDRKPNHITVAHPFPQDNARETDPVANHRLYERACVINGYDPLHIAAVRAVISGPPRDKRYHRLVTDTETTASNARGNLFLKRPFWLVREYAEGPLPPKDTLYPAATIAFLPPGTDIPIPRAKQVLRTSISETGTRTEIPLDGEGSDRRSLRWRIATNGVHSALFVEYEAQAEGVLESRFTDLEGRGSARGFQTRLMPAKGMTRTAEIVLPDYPRMDILLKTPPGVHITRAYVLSDPNDDGNRLRILHRSANRAEVETNNLDGNRLLVFTDAYYPGWRAYVDGTETPILRANEAFKAVVVPPGTHRVEFIFRPARVYAGAGISLAVLLAVLLGLRKAM